MECDESPFSVAGSAHPGLKGNDVAGYLATPLCRMMSLVENQCMVQKTKVQFEMGVLEQPADAGNY